MKKTVIEIVVRDYGTMTAELYPDMARETVKNFVSLAEQHFFDGLIFHRVIKGFMIQGGGYTEAFYTGDFDAKHTDAIKGEFAANGYVQNTLKHTRGVLSMARTADPDSASSQFFVMHKDAPHLDAQYAGFGAVIDGLDVLDKIAGCKTGRLGWFSDVPREPIVIETIRVKNEE